MNKLPAVQVIGLLKTSVQLRISKMLHQIFGLREDQPLPKPTVLLDMCARSMPVAMVQEYQVNLSDFVFVSYTGSVRIVRT